MFSVTYISDVCKQKQMILSKIILFNALTIYQWCNVPFSSGDKALLRNLYRFKKIQFWRILAKFLKMNCNGKKSGNVI